MSEWQPIETVPKEQVTMGVVKKIKRLQIDMYSAGWNIRWLDCGWSEEDGKWYSASKWIDGVGRRTTSFISVKDPTHWMVSPALPEPPPQP